jgi:hypothetical protein
MCPRADTDLTYMINIALTAEFGLAPNGAKVPDEMRPQLRPELDDLYAHERPRIPVHRARRVGVRIALAPDRRLHGVTVTGAEVVRDPPIGPLLAIRALVAGAALN